MPEFPEHKPFFLNLDDDELVQKPTDSLYNKNWTYENNKNKGGDDGTGTNVGSGQNQWVLTPVQSNVEIPNIYLPSGFNKSSAFESINSNEVYQFVYNSNGDHSIFVIDGSSLSITKVITDSNLEFSEDQSAFIANHRVILRVVLDDDKNIVEKYLIWTDGQVWQKWVSVMAAIATDGFNVSTFPYFTLQPPHFDRRELVELAVRPPMIPATVQLIANTPADKGKPNRMIGRAFRISYKYYYTDGRETTIAPWSLPFYVKLEEFLNNPELLPKKASLTLYAGSCMVEKIEIYLQVENGEWYRYDTINGFSNSTNPIGTDYWLRTNKWANYNYNATQNTIEYIFDNSLVGQLVDQSFIRRVQSDLPIRSVAESNLGDALLLGNNESGFDNFGTDVTDKIDISVLQQTSDACNVPLRMISLYAYAGLHGDHVDNEYFISQFPYHIGEDTQMRFGGIQFAYDPMSQPITILKTDTDQSKQFSLDFADRKSFRCYLKGTPYYADAKLFYASSDGSLTEVTQDINISDTSTQQFIFNVFSSLGYFVYKFDFLVPAGIYTAAIARHNTPSTQDWIGSSTYVMGIADSTNTTGIGYGSLNFRSLAPYTAGTIVSNRKEQVVDCRADDVDVWGNGEDLFYIFVPSPLYEGAWPDSDEDTWKFTEGYLKETPDTGALGMELYPYIGDEGFVAENYGGGLYGEYGVTDKNGFFFFYSGRGNADNSNVDIWGNKNCTYYDRNDNFLSTSTGGDSGWFPNQNLYFSSVTGGQNQDCNRIYITGRITNLEGTLGYSNVSISIDGGNIATTDDNGDFTLIAHNGLDVGDTPTRFLYINAGGDFIITLNECELLDKHDYTDPACVYSSYCQVRAFDFGEVGVKIDGGGQQSLKSEANYPVGIVGADLAGRVTYVNLIEYVEVPSFMEQGSVSPSYLHWALSVATPLFPDDIAWVAFVVAKDQSRLHYVQWVGDNFKYLDAAGNVTTDSASAKLIQISIQSLLNANITSNFSLLANYQFVQGDRLKIYDNGDGQLLIPSLYGDPIDVQIVGDTYNQAAINAGLLPTTEIATPLTNEAVIIIEYNAKIANILYGKTGFWIEIYTPSQVNSELPYFEADKWYPVIGGRLAEYVNGGVSAPVYNYPLSGDIIFWDTYFLRRNINIAGVGNKYFWHPFESPNITDNWGKDVSSGGRPNKVNPFARRQWFIDSTIKSNEFTGEGVINGLGTWLASQIKDFKGYGRGGIVAIISQYNVIVFICQNDYFITDYNFRYLTLNQQGVAQANLDDKLGEPHQKIGDNYGCNYEDTGTIVVAENLIGWYDRKNGQYVVSNYQQAKPVSDAGVRSYFIEKSVFINAWNLEKENKYKFDVIAGIDFQNNNIHVTFRPRRNNTRNALSFVNKRRDISIDFQETIVYDLDVEKWSRFVGYCPEAYVSLRGNGAVQEFFTMAAGKIYYHNNTPSTNDFTTFYGVATGTVIKFAINDEPTLVKALKTLAYDCLGMKLYCDLIYESQKNSFSYIPLNLFKTKKKINYGAVLMDMSSFPNYNTPSWTSILIDGMKRMFGQFFIVRFVNDQTNANGYGELSSIFKRMMQSGNNKK